MPTKQEAKAENQKLVDRFREQYRAPARVCPTRALARPRSFIRGFPSECIIGPIARSRTELAKRAGGPIPARTRQNAGRVLPNYWRERPRSCPSQRDLTVSHERGSSREFGSFEYKPMYVSKLPILHDKKQSAAIAAQVQSLVELHHELSRSRAGRAIRPRAPRNSLT